MLPTIALLTSNVMVVLVSFYLKNLALGGLDAVTVLGWANILASIFCIILSRGVILKESSTRKSKTLVITRAVTFSLNYWFFLKFGNLITVPLLILSQTISPFIAMYFVVHLENKHKQFSFSRAQLIQILLLVALVWTLFLSENKLDFNQIKLFFFITVLFALNQGIGKILSNSQSLLWSTCWYFLFSGIILVLVSFYLIQNLYFLTSLGISSAFALSFAILIIQYLFLFGLFKMSPSLSAILLSATVPISFLFDYFLWKKNHMSTQIILCIIFILSHFIPCQKNNICRISKFIK